MGDLIFLEILQGIKNEKEFQQVNNLFPILLYILAKFL